MLPSHSFSNWKKIFCPEEISLLELNQSDILLFFAMCICDDAENNNGFHYVHLLWHSKFNTSKRRRTLTCCCRLRWQGREFWSFHSTGGKLRHYVCEPGGSTGPLVDCSRVPVRENDWRGLRFIAVIELSKCWHIHMIPSVWIWLDLNNLWIYVLQVGWDLLISKPRFVASHCEAAQCGSSTALTQLVAFICVFTDSFLYFHIRLHHPSLHLATDLIRPGLNAFLLLLSDWLRRSLPEQANECWASLRDTSVLWSLWICTESILCMQILQRKCVVSQRQ